MALPPTGLSSLIHLTDGSAESLLGALDRQNCLSAGALDDLPAFVAFLNRAIADITQELASHSGGWAGPNFDDRMAEMLVGSSYLNDNGIGLASSYWGGPRVAVTRYWRIAYLSLALPAEYKLVASSSRQKLPLAGPAGSFATEETRSWADSHSRSVYLLLWQPRAPYPGGPMQVHATWSECVAGRELRVSETSTFMGRARRVLVTHMDFKSPAAQALLYAGGLNRGEFGSIIQDLELRGNELV